MAIRLIPLILLGVTLSAFATEAWGQALCGQHAQIAGDLFRDYKESPRAMGLAKTGAVLEVFATDKGETFTIVYTFPDGLTCLMAAGESWEILPLPVKGDPS